MLEGISSIGTLREMLRLASLAVLLFVCNPACGEILVVTSNATQINALSRESVKNLWLGYTNASEGVTLSVVDLQQGDSIRAEFYQSVIEMSERELKAHWARQVFSGAGFPPEEATDIEQLRRWLAAEPNRIGYLTEEFLDDTLKVLLRVE